ncbi:HAD-superfamily subfamily IB hydrolase, TIGR01490 [Thiorhodococcus drewsii AZ1]|uniref:HAD-superfamily subfamily IB hydrolase, TIGR01490 n=1 Tax=Thiorhodococcus drewsii AZ1 TaxID=765913 RepID=G2DXW4_9GAMM|nr:HAD-IB family hydrolase [Thiorhodococcus drewsii]EGV33163.1 HAD-superfamily subfamily IB hydrolase, TIGR01490 [Thiorhodococcus drewsii AZ1]
MADSAKPVVAAFDFDGTITTRDTFVPFLSLAFGRRRVALAFAVLAVEGVKVWLRLSTRDRFKELIVAKLFRDASVSRLSAVGREHARRIESLIRPAALERIRWHHDQGHHLVMVSASLDLYLEGIAEHLGFQDLLCTAPSRDQSAFDGGLEGPNCRGPEKVRRLEALLGDLSDVELYAYGDSAGDREMLAAADHPYYRPFEAA